MHVTLTYQRRFVSFLRGQFPLVGVLLGAALVSLSLGPYANFDTQVEFAAASSVVTQGLPFSSPGNLVNQPPIGFYLNALFLRVFGLSYSTAVAAVTLWSVGCVFLVYMVGKTFYDAKTGLVAAGVFGLTPWEAVLSRSFLIDVPCLFFSLLALLVGFWALQRASLRLTLASGVLFGVAFLTKFFAVFTLIPLALLFARYPPKSLKHAFAQVGLFAAPVLLMYYVWYEVVSKLGFFSFLGHNDFSSFTQGVTPSPFFLLSFFVDNPGILLSLAVAVSLLVLVWVRNSFEASFFDLVCLATIVGTAGVNVFLVLSLNLNVPYVDPAKYDYQLLPAVCLLAASLLEKARLLRVRRAEHPERSKLPFFASVVGAILLAASVAVNGLTLGSLVGKDTVLFKVENGVAFSFQNVGLVPGSSSQYMLLALGFLAVAACMLLAIRQKPFNKS
jgi:4-amino-4-deoxy-L-arabinose transferase-like glycosyltransferase